MFGDEFKLTSETSSRCPGQDGYLRGTPRLSCRVEATKLCWYSVSWYRVKANQTRIAYCCVVDGESVLSVSLLGVVGKESSIPCKQIAADRTLGTKLSESGLLGRPTLWWCACGMLGLDRGHARGPESARAPGNLAPSLYFEVLYPLGPILSGAPVTTAYCGT